MQKYTLFSTWPNDLQKNPSLPGAVEEINAIDGIDAIDGIEMIEAIDAIEMIEA